MVNGTAATGSDGGERRERSRGDADGLAMLGTPKLNPLGDLHTVQHLAARLARGLRLVFEPLLREEVRAWAEPLSVQRFADYRAERGVESGADGLTVWLPMAMSGTGMAAGGHALVVLDGRFLLTMLDRFFGGTGTVAATLPAELSPSAAALVARLGAALAGPLAQAWEPLARIDFAPGVVDLTPAAMADAEEAMVVTRFGIAAGDGKPATVDILYPVAALKPHATTLAGKVVEKAEPDPAWRHQLTRAAMAVRIQVCSVLAEPVVPLSMLMNLKVGDVIPIGFGAEVPVMAGGQPLGIGTVGAANGRAAVRLTRLHSSEGPDQ